MDTIGLTNIRVEPENRCPSCGAEASCANGSAKPSATDGCPMILSLRLRRPGYKVSSQLFGGYEHDLWTFARRAAEIGAGCGSTAWIYLAAADTSGRPACTTIGHRPKFGEIRRKRFLPVVFAGWNRGRDR